MIEETGDGLIIRPAVAMPIEVYSKERKAGFLLNNTADSDDYEAARIAVREMGWTLTRSRTTARRIEPCIPGC